MLLRRPETSAPFHTFERCRARDNATPMCLIYGGLFGGPDRDRTDDLFRAIFEPQNIDGTVLTTGRTGRNGPMGAICGQNAGKTTTKWPTG